MISGRLPAIMRLTLHVEGSQMLYFINEEGLIDQIESGTAGNTTLTEYFRICTENRPIPKTTLRGRDLMYTDVPKYFKWNQDKNRLELRVNNTPSVPRLYFASMNQGERYFLRLLLTNVRGATSFQNLKNVYGQQFDTFREAAGARGLLLDDRHYHAALTESALWKTGHQLRHFFALILVHSVPANPTELWNAHKDNLTDDLGFRLRRGAPDQSFNIEEVYLFGLSLIEELIVDMGGTSHRWD